MEKRFKILEQTFLFENAQDTLGKLKLPEAAHYEKGDIIYDRTTFHQSLGVVISGRAEAVGQGKTVLSTFREGAVFGAAAIFGNDGSYVSCIRAVSRCTVQFLPEELLRELFLTEPQTAINYIGFLSSRLRFLNGKISVFTQDSAQSRLYRYLTDNCEADGTLPKGMNMTRLAGTLSMGRTSLYRALDALEEQNLIIRKDGKVKVCR